jgi:putative ABC transport system substrate-binding protein
MQRAWRISSQCFCLWLSIAFCALLPVGASAYNVQVISSRAGGAYDEVIESLKSELVKGTELRVHYLSSNDASWRPAESTSLVVALGVDAANAAIQAPESSAPILCVLIPKAAFEALTGGRKEARRVSAIFLDTAPSRQLELIRQLLPQAKRVGTVLGGASLKDRDSIRGFARDKGLTLQAEVALRDTELYSALRSVLSDADVFLAVPDPVVINASTAQNVLITAFKGQVPVIGYSANYVKAGALAAVYSTPGQIGLEAGQVINAHQRTNNLPAPKTARYFTVGLNASVLRSFGLAAVEARQLEQRLLKAD